MTSMMRVAAMVLLVATLSASRAWADAAFLEQKCRAGEVRVCEVAAEATEASDLQRAIELHALACRKNLGCYLVPLASRLSARGNLARAAQLLEQGCHAFKNEAACRELVERYRDGDGVAANPGKAAELFRQACEGGETRPYQRGSSCLALAQLHRVGLGVAKDSARAAALLAQAKKLREEAFAAPSPMEAMVKTNRSLFEFHDKECRSGKLPSCGLAIHLYLPGDPERAWAVLKPSCAAEGCQLWDLVHHLVGAGKGGRAAEIFQEACDLGTLAGCTWLGSWLRQGFVLKQDRARALSLFTAACDDGASDGCRQLSEMFAAGEGGPKDAARATALLRRHKQLSFTQTSRIKRGREREPPKSASARIEELTAEYQKGEELERKEVADRLAAKQAREALLEALAPHKATLKRLAAEYTRQKATRVSGDRLNGPGPMSEQRKQWRALIDQLIGEAVDPP